MGNKRVDQLVLDLQHEPMFNRDDFIISETNRSALKFIELWPKCSRQSVLLSGAEGSGKSHLASIWCQQNGGICVSAQDLRGDILPALLAHNYIVIDDADHPSLDERVLLHALNLFNEHGGGLLLTSRTSDIAQWPVSLDDLRSRLRVLPLVRIGMLNDALLEPVLVKLFTDRQLLVDRSIIVYLMSRMERSFSAAIRLVALLDQRSLACNRPISRGMASEIFK